MRYHCDVEDSVPMYGETYVCNHMVYNSCTLYRNGELGLAVIQQYYDPITKHTWWSHIENKYRNMLYGSPKFPEYFKAKAGISINGLYPTVSIRQMMWALKLKPIKRKPWETCFDHCPI